MVAVVIAVEIADALLLPFILPPPVAVDVTIFATIVVNGVKNTLLLFITEKSSEFTIGVYIVFNGKFNDKSVAISVPPVHSIIYDFGGIDTGIIIE